MRILLFDPINSGEHHAAFNSTIVSAVSRLKDVSSISLLLEERQLKSVYFVDILHDSYVDIYSFRGEDESPDRKQKRAIYLFASFGGIYRRFLNVVDDLKPDIIVFLASDNLIAPFVLMFLRMNQVNPNSKIFVIFHNNLENLTSGSIWIKKAIWSTAVRLSKTIIIVLAPFLKVVGCRMIPNADFVILPHPTYSHFHERLVKKQRNSKRKVDFLFLGRHAYEANRSGFLDRFLQMCSVASSRMLERSVIVALPADIEIDLPEGVTLHTYSPYPDTSRYLKLIQTSRFAVIPSSSGPRLTASGVLADLLSLGTPVIAPKMGAWQWQVAPKNQALLFEDIADLRSKIVVALSVPEKEYQALSLDVLSHGTTFDLDATSKRLSIILLQM